MGNNMSTKEMELIASIDRFKFQVDNFVAKVKTCNANRVISDSQHIVENYHELERELLKTARSFEDPQLKKLSGSWHDYINYAYRFDRECLCKRLSEIIEQKKSPTR